MRKTLEKAGVSSLTAKAQELASVANLQPLEQPLLIDDCRGNHITP